MGMLMCCGERLKRFEVSNVAARPVVVWAVSKEEAEKTARGESSAHLTIITGETIEERRPGACGIR